MNKLFPVNTGLVKDSVSHSKLIFGKMRYSELMLKLMIKLLNKLVKKIVLDQMNGK